MTHYFRSGGILVVLPPDLQVDKMGGDLILVSRIIFVSFDHLIFHDFSLFII